MLTSLREWLGIRGLEFAVPLAAMSAALALCWTLPSALIPIAALTQLGDAQKVSVFFFAVSSIGVVGALCIPLFVHIVGRRFLFAFGVICVMTSALCLSSPTLGLLIIGTGLRVFGFLCADIVLELVIMERIPRRNLARFEAVRMFSMGGGLIIGPWLGVWLSGSGNSTSPYVLICLVMTLVAIYTFFSRLSTTLSRPRLVHDVPNPFRFIRRFCQQPRLRLAWILAFARSAWWTMFFIYAPIYCVQVGLGESFAGAILSVGSAAILLAPIFGKLASRMGVRWLLAIGYSATGVATVLAAVVADSAYAGVGLLLVASIFAATIDAVGNALFLRAAHAHERAEMAAVFTTYREMAQLGPPGVFAIVLKVFALPAVFVVSGLSLLAVTYFTRYIPRRFK